ncbi:hypothetical protein S726_004032 [Salmonella enterica subsp. enterica]|nr:hypothetical protein [Salmonella enterica subsp. enterica]
MAIPSEKKEEMIKLIGFYDDLTSLMQNYHHQIITNFCSSWNKNRETLMRILDGDKSFGSLSQNVAGLKQGIKDMQDIATYVPISERRFFLREYSNLVKKYYPDSLKKDEKKINSIIKRGRIRNEDEFYLVEFFFERLHEANPDGDDSVALRRIMDEFEFGAR